MKSSVNLIIIILLLSACNTKQAPADLTIIKGGTIIDLSNNGKSIRDISNGYIILEGEKIIAVGEITENTTLPKAKNIIDANWKFIIPGLIDGFAVMNNQAYANAFLYSGITTIIGVDGGRRGDFFYDPKPGPDYYMLESVGDEFKSDSLHLADLYYLYEQDYRIALLKYKLRKSQTGLVNEKAHELNMGTIGELGYTSYKEGAKIGIDVFVHTTRYSLDVAPKNMREAVAEEPFSDDLNSPKWKYYKYLYNLDTADRALHEHAQHLASSNTYIMPTLSLLYQDLPDSKNPWLEPVANIINADDINNPVDKVSGRHNYTAEQQENYTAMGLQELKIEGIYQRAGCRYLAGSATDVWGTMPGISLHTELFLLKRIGLSNREVIAAATSNFSRAFNWDTGEIKKEFDADILILNNNPLESLENLKQISVMINNGKIINREKLLEFGNNN